MPSVTFQDSGIARGFATLADVFVPNPQNIMRAALMGAQREQAMARASLYDANTAQTTVQTDALRALPDIMAAAGQGGAQASPAQLGRMIGVIAQAPAGLQYGPAFATGAMTFANPGWRAPAELSRTMVASGVQTYGNTPTGYGEGLQSAERTQAEQNASRERVATEGNVSWERQRQREAELDAQTRRTIAAEGNQAYRDVETAKLSAAPAATGGRPRTVGSGELQRMSENMKARLAARYNVKPDSLDVDQDVQTAMRDTAARVFQETGNAEAAIEAGVSAVATRFQGASWLPWGARARVVREAPPSIAPAAPATPAGPGIAAPPPPPPSATGFPTTGQTPTPAAAGAPMSTPPPSAAPDPRQFGAAFARSLAARFRMAPEDLRIPPEVASVLQRQAAEAFRRTGNMDSAVEQAIRGTPLDFQSDPWSEPMLSNIGPLAMLSNRVIGRAGAVSIVPGALPLPPQNQALREGAVIRRTADGKLFVRRDNWLMPYNE